MQGTLVASNRALYCIHFEVHISRILRHTATIICRTHPAAQRRISPYANYVNKIWQLVLFCRGGQKLIY